MASPDEIAARIAANPDDPTCTLQRDQADRLEFANAIDAVDPERAALIRNVYNPTPTPTQAARWSPFDGMSARFWRGFVAHLQLDAGEFLRQAPDLYRRAPITEVTLTNATWVIDELAASPLLRRLRRISCKRQGLLDNDLRVFAQSPHLDNLIELDLSGNPITLQGLRMLIGAKMPRRGYVDCHDTQADVHAYFPYTDEGFHATDEIVWPDEGAMLGAPDWLIPPTGHYELW
jgi:hypothetical protein